MKELSWVLQLALVKDIITENLLVNSLGYHWDEKMELHWDEKMELQMSLN